MWCVSVAVCGWRTFHVEKLSWIKSSCGSWKATRWNLWFECALFTLNYFISCIALIVRRPETVYPMWTKDTAKVLTQSSNSPLPTFPLFPSARLFCHCWHRWRYSIFRLRNSSSHFRGRTIFTEHQWVCDRMTLCNECVKCCIVFCAILFSLFRSLSITIIIASLHSHATCRIWCVAFST